MFRLAARNFAARNIASGSVVAPRFALAARSRIVPCAAFSAAAGLSKEEITARVLQVLRSFEKVKADKLNPTASFSDDLGLDSLDAVEVVMAVEEEFAIEIPDAEADEIKTVQQAIDYIAKTPAGEFFVSPLLNVRELTLYSSPLARSSNALYPSHPLMVFVPCISSISTRVHNPCLLLAAKGRTPSMTVR
ncbi:acyl carrier protein [Trametes versicolor FP-101664 SS1]|uniref:acyl carrier protein n=1 Tax=Trametes versicolor (strain FP-101664) TaxID=717944 RepID=UPI000462183D|nr:acyl carrier protein [Trametes versicolor FP-101664 SS1]EIW64389.1 acyl carrier protein [Trametes versicolor FP-101664 SS1]